MITLYAEQKKRHRCIEQSFRLCGRRWGWDVSREQHQNVYYLGWNRSPAQVGCMRQALGPGALGRPRGSGWRGRWKGCWDGDTCKPMAVSFQCMTKSTIIYIKKMKKKETMNYVIFTFINHGFNICKFTYLLKFNYNSKISICGIFKVIHRHVNAQNRKKFWLSAQWSQGRWCSFFLFQLITVNKYLFYSLSSATFFLHFCVLLVTPPFINGSQTQCWLLSLGK